MSVSHPVGSGTQNCVLCKNSQCSYLPSSPTLHSFLSPLFLATKNELNPSHSWWEPSHVVKRSLSLSGVARSHPGSVCVLENSFRPSEQGSVVVCAHLRYWDTLDKAPSYTVLHPRIP